MIGRHIAKPNPDTSRVQARAATRQDVPQIVQALPLAMAVSLVLWIVTLSMAGVEYYPG